jgi:hypothetical protein
MVGEKISTKMGGHMDGPGQIRKAFFGNVVRKPDRRQHLRSANLTEGSTFEDMLKQAIAKQVTGSWASGRMQGNWWLMGPGY